MSEFSISGRLFKANASGCRYVIHQGGTGSGKTFAALQYLLFTALGNQNLTISVVAETLPHLKRGAMRDFKSIVSMLGMDSVVSENKTDHTFKIGTSLIEFFSADAEAKLRGARRDILFINECNNIDYEAFQQLDVRTRRQTILDFNPVRRFWVHDHLLPTLHADEHLFIKSTYVDNDHLSPQEKQNIERRRSNLNWWKVYGEGEIGMAEGVVFSNWTIINGELTMENNSEQDSTIQNSTLSIQHSNKLPGNLLGYGIDFGFTHSPTALVQIHECNGELYIHELLYRTGIQNDELFAFAQKHIDLRALTVADSAEPKTIDYLYRKGWHGLKAATKGSDSVEFGINLLLDRKLNITAESVNLIKELRQYMWDTNKDGHFIRRPIKDFDHAIDAIRYVVTYPKKRRLVFA
jgi:phage terminase large subunit